MISVLPCRDPKTIKAFFERHNIKTEEFSGCVIASQNDDTIGYCLYSLTKDKITVFAVEPQSDILLADGILRSALHVAAENFVFDAFYSESAPIELFNALGFIKNKDENRLDMDKLFAGCNCHNKN